MTPEEYAVYRTEKADEVVARFELMARLGAHEREKLERFWKLDRELSTGHAEGTT